MFSFRSLPLYTFCLRVQMSLKLLNFKDFLPMLLWNTCVHTLPDLHCMYKKHSSYSPGHLNCLSSVETNLFGKPVTSYPNSATIIPFPNLLFCFLLPVCCLLSACVLPHLPHATQRLPVSLMAPIPKVGHPRLNSSWTTLPVCHALLLQIFKVLLL